MSGLTCISLAVVHCVKRQSFISKASMFNTSTKGEWKCLSLTFLKSGGHAPNSENNSIILKKKSVSRICFHSYLYLFKQCFCYLQHTFPHLKTFICIYICFQMHRQTIPLIQIQYTKQTMQDKTLILQSFRDFNVS